MHALFTEWFIYSNSFHKGMGELLYIFFNKIYRNNEINQKKEI